jgi:prepilin-type N-terminal cleavage/methylation domain-containing protein
VRKRLRALKGFTIPEILIALSVITIALLGTIAAIAFGLKASKLGADNTVAIQINRKVLELILQGVYPSDSTPPLFPTTESALTSARGTDGWKPVFLPTGTNPRWFLLTDYGYVAGTQDAENFTRDTQNSEVSVSATDVVEAGLHVSNRFKRIVVQTRWQEKGQNNWKVVRTEAFSLAEAD